ncbi:MAG: hypothetical protein BroJett003_10340 [Planctomycetota bacterium]|nr:MAG: hypothetical protein BroJett003_10340 [Planctomycetota bacterium]
MDPDLQELQAKRFRRTCELTEALFRSLTPQERDRMMQRHLAQAMGSRGRLRMASAMTEFLLAVRRAAQTPDQSSPARTSGLDGEVSGAST